MSSKELSPLGASRNNSGQEQDLSCDLSAVTVLASNQAKYKTFFRNGEYIHIDVQQLVPGQEFPGQMLFDDGSTDGSDDGTIASRLAEVSAQGFHFTVPGPDADDGSNVE